MPGTVTASAASGHEGTVDLRLREAVELAHALVAWIAAEEGIRVLFFKGPIANLQGLRPPRDSSDVDVWVDPPRREALIAALKVDGWFPRPTASRGRILPAHAIHLVNNDWPCDLDLHDQYPGLFAEKVTVFELLWERRAYETVANVPVPCTDVISSIVLMAAHALRDPHRARSTSELTFLSRAALRLLDDSALAELDEVIGAVRANETLRPLSAAIGRPAAAADLTPSERRLWTLRISDPTQSTGWLIALSRVPLLRRPRAALRMIVPSDVEMLARDPSLNRGLPMTMARTGRIGKGLIHLVAAGAKYGLHRLRGSRDRG